MDAIRNKKKIKVKAVVIMLLLIINTLSINSTVNEIYETRSENEDAGSYDDCVEEGDYNRLRELMVLYDAYGEEFAAYWELADGYMLLQDYKMWKKASELEEAAGEKADESLGRLKDLCDSSGFARNSLVLKNFVEQAGGYVP